jgi:hypothetical protein
MLTGGTYSPDKALCGPLGSVAHLGRLSLDILPATNDQDCNRTPEGNMCRFALHRRGQDSQVAARGRAMGWRGSLLVLPNSARLGYRPTGLNAQPSTGRRKGFLPARNDRVCTLGEVR